MEEVSILKKYLPEKSVDMAYSLIEQEKVFLKIVNQRQTKHGDFKVLPDGRYEITVNNNLNKYQFLLTLIHEIAHQVTYQKYGRVQSHGVEWKKTFRNLMYPFLKTNIFPSRVLTLIASHLKNPRASTDADVQLSLALKEYSRDKQKNFIFEIPHGSLFEFRQSIYKLTDKQRTRYKCIDMSNDRPYLFNQNAEVTPIIPNKKKNFIFELKPGNLFKFQKTVYKLGSRYKKRYQCLDVEQDCWYLFSPNVEVKVLDRP